MAQTQVITDTGIAELVALWRGAAATAASKIVCMVEASNATCTAAVGSTFANPASACTLASGSGLSIASVTTVSVATVNTTNDTITWDHEFTASGTITTVGVHIVNTDADVSYVECCFNAAIAMESSDTLTIDAQSTINQA